MDIIEAIRNRRSIRAFKPDPVPKKVLRELLDISRWAPSGGNAQPWHFVILGGKLLDEVKRRLEKKAKTSWDGNNYADSKPDIPRTAIYSKLLMSRQQSLKVLLDSIRYVPSNDNLDLKQLETREKSLRFFDAPNVIIICSDDRGPSAIEGIGIVSQTICLAALTYELGTCIMGLPSFWPEIFRELLNIPKDRAIISGIAIGYPDFADPINTFSRPRERLDNLTEWHGL